MDCLQIRTAISARLDGEDPGVDPTIVGSHTATCPSCQTFERDARKIHHATRLVSAPIVPDMTAQILTSLGDVESERSRSARSRVDAIRLALAVVACVQIGLATPALLLGENAGLPVHAARHLGSFAVALGIGFLLAAWRPDRVAGMFAIVAVVVICLLGTTLVDVAAGRAGVSDELAHSTELIGLAGLWMLSRTRAETSASTNSGRPAVA